MLFIWIFLLYIKIQYQSRIIYKQIQNVPAKIQTYFVVEAIKRQPYKQINLFIWLAYRLLRDFYLNTPPR